MLSDEEQARALRYKFPQHQQQFVIFHGFMRQVLARYLGLELHEVVFKKGDKGKPYIITSDSDKVALQFNLSHTQNVALLALSSDLELGVDIEHTARKTDWQGISRRFFTDTEQAALLSLTEKEQEEAFYDLWTRKEAYMKVIGSGLALAPTQFSLTVLPQPPALISHDSDKFRPDWCVQFQSLSLPENLDGFCATVAASGSIESCRIYEFN